MSHNALLQACAHGFTLACHRTGEEEEDEGRKSESNGVKCKHFLARA